MLTIAELLATELMPDTLALELLEADDDALDVVAGASVLDDVDAERNDSVVDVDVVLVDDLDVELDVVVGVTCVKGTRPAVVDLEVELDVLADVVDEELDVLEDVANEEVVRVVDVDVVLVDDLEIELDVVVGVTWVRG